MLFNEIFSRVKLISILIVISSLVSVISKKVKMMQGPSGMSILDHTNCSEFSKFARFNPLSVLHEKWFVFYYWAPPKSHVTFIFTFPTANHTKHLKRLFDGKVVLPVMWSARQILMEDNEHYISLLVERSDRGEYWMYPVAKVQGSQKITPRDIRLKQTGDNRLLGLMDCVDETVLAMARLNDVPRKDKLYEEASRLGYRGRRGKSYLYQGHEWGPIPEADEELYWDYGKRGLKDTSTKDKKTEGSSEEVESEPTNESKHSKEKKRKSGENIAVPPAANVDHEMCVKVEPELWNDPKPKPNPSILMTKEELNNLDDILDTNNTLALKAPDLSTNNEQETKLGKESDIMQKIDKLDNQKDVLKNKMEMAPKEPKNVELHMENPGPKNGKENCVVCYSSQVSYISTNEPYRSESTRSITNLKKNEEAPRLEQQRTEIPRAEVPHPEEPLAKKPLAEVPRAKKPRAKIPRGKTPPTPKTPQQDLTNSSEVIILSPKKLVDLKS